MESVPRRGFTPDMHAHVESILLLALAEAEAADPATLVDDTKARLAPEVLARALRRSETNILEFATFCADGRLWEASDFFEPVWYMRPHLDDRTHAAFCRDVRALHNAGVLASLADVVQREDVESDVRCAAAVSLARVAASRDPDVLSDVFAGCALFPTLLRLLAAFSADDELAGAGSGARRVVELMEAVVEYGVDKQVERATAEGEGGLVPFKLALSSLCSRPPVDIFYPGGNPPLERQRLAMALGKLGELLLYGDACRVYRVGEEMPKEEGLARQARALEAAGALEAMGEAVVELARTLQNTPARDARYLARAAIDLLKTLKEAALRLGTGSPAAVWRALDQCGAALAAVERHDALGVLAPGLRNYQRTFAAAAARTGPRPGNPAAGAPRPAAAAAAAEQSAGGAAAAPPRPAPSTAVPERPAAPRGGGGRSGGGSGLVRGFFNR
eukprot:tig00000246_g21497.t1